MLDITSKIKEEFEKRTHYKAVRCHLNKGSMKEFATIHINDIKGEYEKFFKNDIIGDIKIKFVNRSYGNKSKVWFDIPLTEFKEV